MTYRTPSAAATTSQVATLRQQAGGYDKTYTYGYDNNGNIVSIGDSTNTTTYVYDSANQLVRENNQSAGKTWVYTYDNAAAPLATLNELVLTLLVVIIAVSAIILALILTLWTKTRIHEIGVFLSVGIRKSAIIGQYLMEVLLIAVLAFGLSYFTSNAIAGQIGNHLLEQSMQTGPVDDEAVSAAAAVDVGVDNLIQKPLPTENGIQVSVELDNLAQLYLIGIVIIIVAVSVSSITVMRLKPREILSKIQIAAT